MLRGSRLRPEGAVTSQPRATPWDHVDHPTSEPCKGETKPGFHRRLRHRDIGELCRPYRACGSLESEFPGRCPGLSCRCPCGTKDENSATSKLAPRVGIGTNAFVRDWLKAGTDSRSNDSLWFERPVGAAPMIARSGLRVPRVLIVTPAFLYSSFDIFSFRANSEATLRSAFACRAHPSILRCRPSSRARRSACPPSSSRSRAARLADSRTASLSLLVHSRTS